MVQLVTLSRPQFTEENQSPKFKFMAFACPCRLESGYTRESTTSAKLMSYSSHMTLTALAGAGEMMTGNNMTHLRTDTAS